MVHPRRLPAAVVKKVQLAGQDLGLGRAGLGRQLDPELDLWSTVGVSENIIEASWLALVDSFEHFLAHAGK